MRLRPVTLVVTFAVGILVWPLPAEAQQGGKVPRIGYLSPGSFASLRAFRQGLRELGYVEGQNILSESRLAKGKVDRLPQFAAELVNLKVDVILALGVKAGLAAKKATTTIPIVVVTGADLVRAGLVDSLTQPGGNLTGFTAFNPDLGGKRLELLKEAFPSVSRVGVLRDPDMGIAAERTIHFRQVETSAEALGVEHHPIEVGATNPDFEGALQAAMKRHVDALMVVGGTFFIRNRARIAKLVAKTRLPAMYTRVRFVKAGGLMSYGPRRDDSYRSAATYVDKILKGAKPTDLPVQRATRFYLDINLKTAKKQGLTIPPQFLARADKVIK